MYLYSTEYLFFKASLPMGSDGLKKTRLQCRRPGFDPWVGKIPREGNGNFLRYSSLENPVDRGGWWLHPWGHKESDMIEWLTLSLFTHVQT